MSTRIGSKAFLSYRTNSKSLIVPIGEWLTQSGICGSVAYVPPGKISVENELMLPFELFELMFSIWNTIEDCDSFVYIDTVDYLSSVWTNIEIAGWRYFARNPIGHSVSSGWWGKYTLNQVRWSPMRSAEKSLWSHLRRHLEPFANLRSREAAYRGGHFSKNYFLLPCQVCGQYSLFPKSMIESGAKSGKSISCGHCNESHRLTQRGDYIKIRYRSPILAIPSSSHRIPLRVLDAKDLQSLYAARSADEVPSFMIVYH